MPYQLTPGPDFLRVAFFGQVTRPEFGDALRELVALEAAAGRVPDRLTDLGGVESSELNADDIRNLARRRRETPYANSFRSAIYAPKPAQFGYSRMFQVLNHHPNVTLQVFTDEAAAIAWLRAKTPHDAASRSVPST